MKTIAQAWLGLVIAAFWILPAAANTLSASLPCTQNLGRIPPRDGSAPSGSEFARDVVSMDERARDAAIRSQLLAGNMPSFLRTAVPVELLGPAISGVATRLTLCVLPDYLSIGSDHDFLLIPISLESALSVADAFGFVLPTRKIVDAIFAQAAVRLPPQPLPASDRMRSMDYYVLHNRMLRAQRASIDASLMALTAGHKKDLVITKQLWTTPGRVAIYGWHRSLEAPIQPLSTFHGARYADYSHGVRLVSTIAYVNGEPKSLFDVLEDSQFAATLSDEGPYSRLQEALRTLAGVRENALPLLHR